MISLLLALELSVGDQHRLIRMYTEEEDHRHQAAKVHYVMKMVMEKVRGD